MSERPLILVLGASGTVGRFLLPRLIAAGAQILALSRCPAKSAGPHITWVQHDLDTGPAPAEAGVLVSAGPLRHAVVQAKACERLGRVVALSSASVLFKKNSSDREEREKIRELVGVEGELSQICETRGIALTLLRPCMIYGGDADANVSRLKMLVGRLPIVPVAGRGLRQPVHADDLAKAAVTALERGDAAGGVFALGGGETLDYAQMLKRIGASESRPVRVLRVPAPLLTFGLGIAHLCGRLQDVSAAMLRRQARDLVVDDHPARELLGWSPRPFRP